MYPSYMSKPTFMTNTSNTSFGASTSTFGQPSANTSMFSSMQPTNIFQTPSTSSFNPGPSAPNTFAVISTNMSPGAHKKSQDSKTSPGSGARNSTATGSQTTHSPTPRPASSSSIPRPIDSVPIPRPISAFTVTLTPNGGFAGMTRSRAPTRATSPPEPIAGPSWASDPAPGGSSSPIESGMVTTSRGTTLRKHGDLSEPLQAVSPKKDRESTFNSDTAPSLNVNWVTLPASLSGSSKKSNSKNRSESSSHKRFFPPPQQISPFETIVTPSLARSKSNPNLNSKTQEVPKFYPCFPFVNTNVPPFTASGPPAFPRFLPPIVSRNESMEVIPVQSHESMGSLPDADAPGKFDVNMISAEDEYPFQFFPTFNNMPVFQQMFPFQHFGTGLFGQQQQPSTSGLFGSSNAFGQNKPGFGFGSTQPQTGLFGQQPQQQPGSSLFQSNTTSLFGSSTFGNQTQGTVIKFQPVTGTDTMQKNGVTQSISTKHHCITCMKEYESKSLEELRFEDYSCNRKGPQQQTGFGTTPFGASTGGASTSLFGQTDNKQAFGQPQTFGQTSAFGQTAPAFGVSNQTNTPNLFGKPNAFGATTSATPSFGFNASLTTANPFSASQAPKSFSQPLFGSTTTQAQPSFGTGVFGQTNTQNTGANLFQKPAQPTTGFNTGQQGFSFNQAGTTQPSNLFQVSKPNTGFGIFGQTNTTPTFGQTTQPTFGTNFGKLPQSTFTQPTQPAFGTNLTSGLQQPLLFGNNATKPPSLFGVTCTGTSLFNNNVFQQTPTNFPLNMAQPQTTQFPPENSDDMKSVSFIATDSFPDGPHIFGLEPVMSGLHNSATNPQDLKLLLDHSKKREELGISNTKIKTQTSKAKRGNNLSKEFFETNQTLKGSHKCLVIRKFNETNDSPPIYGKYKNELLEEAEECLKVGSESEMSVVISSPRSVPPEQNDSQSEKSTDYKDRIKNMKLKFDSFSDETSDTGTLDEIPNLSSRSTDSKSGKVRGSPRNITLTLIDEELNSNDTDSDAPIISSPPAEPAPEITENPAGVVLTRPEYYMYPALRDLHQYMDDNGECVVQGLTIGRRGYGNVYFPDPINIANMNLDEIIHFRHREVIIYPDDIKKPPVGEGLNRRAQVTLDKIYPREKGTNNYVTDINQIIQTNFVDKLMNVTQKHDCKFVDYRPKTGSWVFKVKHFSKYAFTDSDEEECEVNNEKLITKKAQDILKKIEEADDIALGLGGAVPSTKSRPTIKNSEPYILESSLDYLSHKEFMLEDELFHTSSAIQTLKSTLFINMDTISEARKVDRMIEAKPQIRSEVLVFPKVHKLPDISLLIAPQKIISNQRCLTELAIFRCNTFKIGWGNGLSFYTTDALSDNEVVYTLNHCNLNSSGSDYFNTMMPNMNEMLQVTLDESTFTYDSNKIPTLRVKADVKFLEKQTQLFNAYVDSHKLSRKNKYLASIWNLCLALWGPGDNTVCGRRELVSQWLKTFSYDLSDECNISESFDLTDSESFKIIYNLLSFYKVREACEFANRNKLNRLSLLISQVTANERYKYWMEKYIDTFAWQEKDIITDDFKKLFLLLSGIPVKDNINTCVDLNWMRSFGIHLWYMSPAASSVNVAFNSYKKAFEEDKYACKPIPPYCNLESQTSEFDLLYHILSLYVNGAYQLCKLLHPETHTENIMDYRLSWFLLQLFQSLQVGLVRDSEKQLLHTTFSTQLENMGYWKWAVLPLLFLSNNVLKKNLIMKLLDRHLSSDTTDIENELVNAFKIPPNWIHDIKATKAKTAGLYYDYFQYYLYLDKYQEANLAFVDHILPELLINEHFDYLKTFVDKLAPYSEGIVNWHTQGGLIYDFLELRATLLSGDCDEGIIVIANKLSSVFRRVNCFPVDTDLQKLCVAELSRKCALLFKIIRKQIEEECLQSKFVDLLNGLIVPPDIKHFEVYSLFSKDSREETELGS